MGANNFTVVIKPQDAEAYNLGSVTQSPRVATTLDLEAACANLDLAFDPGTPEFVVDFAGFLFRRYFVDAHQTGLYNRQMRLCETLSKITSIQARALEKGIFSKKSLPVYELVGLTQSRQPVVMALYIDSAFASTVPVANLQQAYLDQLRDFLARVAKTQSRLGAAGVKGLFVMAPAPFPSGLLNFVEKAIGAEDPVARFDSLLGAPYYAHINLLEYASADADGALDAAESQSDSHLLNVELTMVHPQLRARSKPAEVKKNSAQISYS